MLKYLWEARKMSMFDEARSIAVMMKMRGLSQTETAKMLGVSQPYIANKLRLLQLDEGLQNKICASGMTERHARSLLRLSPEQRGEALDRIIAKNLSVAESEALIDFMRSADIPRKIGGADRIRGIDMFIKETKNTLSALSSIGVTTSQKVSYHGSKIMITIAIENV